MEVKKLKTQSNSPESRKSKPKKLSNTNVENNSTVSVQCDSNNGKVDHGIGVWTCDMLLEKKCVQKLSKFKNSQEIDRSQSPLLPWENFPSPASDTKTSKSNNNRKYDSKPLSNKIKTNFLKKNVSRITVKKKSSNQKDGFFYHSNYSQYVEEYRRRKRSLPRESSSDCENRYTIQDVQKMYNDLKTYPKMMFKSVKTMKTEKVVPTQSITNRSRGDDDTCEDNTPDKTNNGINLTPSTNIITNTDKDNIVGSNEDMDAVIDRHLGRSFFGYTHRCPVIDIAIPEKHTITRLANESTGSGKSRASNESGFIYGIDELAVSEWDGDDSSRSDVDTNPSSSFYSNAVSPITKTSDASPSSLNGISGLNAAIRDLQPFSRNGIKTRLKRSTFLKKNNDNCSVDSKNSSSGYGSLNNDSETSVGGEKQPVPWKALKHLGYKPSMRKYLKEIYTPIKKERSLGSDEHKHNNCFVSGRTLGTYSPSNKDGGKLVNNVCSLRISGHDAKTISNNKNSENMGDISVIHTIIEKRLLSNNRPNNVAIAMKQTIRMHPTERKTNLAIVSNCKTVVRPPVSNKHLAVN